MKEQRKNTETSQSTNNQELNEIIDFLNKGGSYLNEVADYQFVLKADGTMIRYQNFKYTFYTDIVKFARVILRTIKRGY